MTEKQKIERLPEHGVPSEHGETVPHGHYDGTERVNQPDPDSDVEPRL